MNGEMIRINRDETKEWLTSWEDALSDFLLVIKKVNSITEESGTFGEKFAKLRKYQMDYNITKIPSNILMKLLSEPLQKMNGVVVTEDEKNCSVKLWADTLEITLKIGHNTGVTVQDHEPYAYPRSESYIHDGLKRYALKYRRFKNGEITKWELRKEFAQVQKDILAKNNKKGFPPKTFIISLRDVYTMKQRGFDLLDSTIKSIEENERIAKEKECQEEKNRARNEKRLKVLRESGLHDLLKSLSDAGEVFKTAGITHDKEWGVEVDE